METQVIEAMIKTGIPDAQVTVTGDGSHFDAIVVSDAFVGKSLLQQQKMIYATLGDKITSGELHALSIKSYTHSQWAAQRGA